MNKTSLTEADASSLPIKYQRARLIVNPEAGQVLVNSDQLEQIIHTLHGYHIDADISIITPEHSGETLAHEAINSGYDIVVAVGGDGTVHQVATTLQGSRVVLGIIPLGTMNNLAYSLHIPTDIAGACHIIGMGRRHAIDIGYINGHPFIEVASIGAEATFFPVAENMRHRGIKGAIGAAVTGLRLLLHLQMHPLIIELDGKSKRFHAWQVTICNAPVYGLRFAAAPKARIDDGLLDVVIARHSRRWDLIRHYQSIMTGQRLPRLRTTIRHARHIRIFGHYRLPAAADAQSIGMTPVNITVEHRAVNVMMGFPLAKPVDTSPPSPLSLIMQSIITPYESTNPNVHTPSETARRMGLITRLYWMIVPVLLGIGALLRWQRWWPFRDQDRGGRPVETPVEAENPILARIIAFTMSVIFLRLRLTLEVLGLFATRLVAPILRLFRQIARIQPEVVVPDEGTMRAITGTGILAAGLWASRRSTWRRNFLLAGLGALGTWLARSGRRGSAQHERDAVALGAGLGVLWLGGLLYLLARVQRTLVRLTSSIGQSHHVIETPSPPLLESTDMAPTPSKTIVPIAIQQPLERGDLVLFGPDHTFGAWLIEMLTRSYYHHIAIYDGEGMVVEAMPEGVNRYALGNRSVTGIRPEVLPEQRRAAADWARQHVGGMYDTRGVFLIAIDRVFPGLRLGNVAANRFSCAVFIADAYLRAGVDLLPGHRWQDLVPADFMALLDRVPQ
jgi:diacylglycerol kinase (ATP)